MLIKAAIVISGAAIASAVAAFPPFAADELHSQRTASLPHISAVPVAKKGDRQRILAEPCTNAAEIAICADIYGVAAAPRPTLTVERRIGDSTSVLIRMPLSQVASR